MKNEKRETRKRKDYKQGKKKEGEEYEVGNGPEKRASGGLIVGSLDTPDKFQRTKDVQTVSKIFLHHLQA